MYIYYGPPFCYSVHRSRLPSHNATGVGRPHPITEARPPQTADSTPSEDPLPDTVNEAGGTHPTGMYTCCMRSFQNTRCVA